MSNIKLINDDCLNAMKDIADNSVDMILTDPPYKIIQGGRKIKGDLSTQPKGIFTKTSDEKNVKSGKLFKHNDIKFKDWMPEMFRILKEGTHSYFMVNDRNLNNLITEAENSGFKLQNILIWKKNNATPNRYYMKCSEFIVMFRKGKAKNINNMGTKTVLEVNNVRDKTHPTEKPVELLEILINNSSDEGDLIFEPFLGTGSCGVACQNLNRKFIGIELDEEYFKIAEKRINGVK